jgi:hypothetical protein
MTSIAEQFRAEVLARMQAAPNFGVDVGSIRRSHLTVLPREKCPAIYCRFKRQKPTDGKACDWRWSMEFSVSVFSRDDSGATAADAIIVEALKRLESTTLAPYANAVMVELIDIDVEDEIADEDAFRADINCVAKFVTAQWQIDVAP